MQKAFRWRLFDQTNTASGFNEYVVKVVHIQNLFHETVHHVD